MSNSIMKAAVIHQPRSISFMNQEIPQLGKFEILVKVAYCGICGTDIHIYEGKVPQAKYPIIAGHEFSGVIVDKGLKVDTVNIGDKVAINPNLSCKDFIHELGNLCYYCEKYRPHFCINWQALGVTHNGGFAEYVKCPCTSVVKISPNVSLKEATFMEPIACCLHGLNKVHISDNDTILIIGAGPIGLLMTSLIKSISNPHIIVSEIKESRRKLALQVGADLVIDPSSSSLADIVSKETHNYGVDISIEAVGGLETSIEAIKLLNKGGRALLFGVSKPTEKMSLNLFDLYNRELSLFGSFTNPHENVQAMELLERKIIKPKILISHFFSLEKLKKALLLIKNNVEGVNKTLIEFKG
ncbi:MAG: alcohol dehydrogenase catalytic domain-containing protein [Candidatus Hodarchaeales archaeon]